MITLMWTVLQDVITVGINFILYTGSPVSIIILLMSINHMVSTSTSYSNYHVQAYVNDYNNVM